MNNLDFIVTYIDESHFKGNLNTKGWRVIPDNKKIKSIQVRLFNYIILLENYLEYDFTKEIMQLIGGKQLVRNIKFVGRKEEESDIIECDFTTKKINKYSKKRGSEYSNLISNTWVKGRAGFKPKVAYKRI